MRSDLLGTRVWFDPVGLYVEPGTTVRWVARENVHTTTAYTPRNANHPLRIPDGAVPSDSGFLVHPGDHFDVTLTVPGVYDYYCMPHEAAGMVGRIVVGRSNDSAARPFDYWVGQPGTDRLDPRARGRANDVPDGGADTVRAPGACAGNGEIRCQSARAT